MTVKRGKLNESFTRKITYTNENVQATAPIPAKNVSISNNKGKSDTIKIKGLVKKQKIKVYDSKGKLLTSKTATGRAITLTVKQLGKSAGSLYVARQVDGKELSQRIKIKFNIEK